MRINDGMRMNDGKKKGMRSNIMAVLLMITAALLLTGCSSAKLSSAFDEAVVLETAKSAVGKLSNGDYEGVESMVREDLRELISGQVLKDGMESAFPDLGAFQDYASTAVVGQKNQSTQEDSAVAVLVASYENRKITYTISFDVNMQIIGFYMK